MRKARHSLTRTRRPIMNHKLLIPLVTLILLSSCAERYSVTGSSATMLDGTMAFIRTLDGPDGKDAIDSCEIVHGQFQMDGNIDSAVCVRLSMGNENFPMVLEPGNIRISITDNVVKLEGTPLNDSLYHFLMKRDSLQVLFDDLPHKESVMYLDGYTQEEIAQTLTDESNRLNYALDRLDTEFINNNIDNALGVMWFLRLCYDAREWYGFPTTTPQIDEIYLQAPEAFKQNRLVKEYMNQVDGGLSSQ